MGTPTQETSAAYQAFVAYRDSDQLRIGDHGPTAYDWSRWWQWAQRCYEYDLHLGRVDVEDMVRYRRKMNDRHRRTASLAQQTVVQALLDLDPATRHPTDAARLLDVGSVWNEQRPDRASHPSSR